MSIAARIRSEVCAEGHTFRRVDFPGVKQSSFNTTINTLRKQGWTITYSHASKVYTTVSAPSAARASVIINGEQVVPRKAKRRSRTAKVKMTKPVYHHPPLGTTLIVTGIALVDTLPMLMLTDATGVDVWMAVVKQDDR